MRPLKTPTIQWVPDNASKIYDYFYETALLVEPNHGPFHTGSCTEKITQINWILSKYKKSSGTRSRKNTHFLVFYRSEYYKRALIYKKVKGDFSGYEMGIWYTHFLNGAKYVRIVDKLVFQGI